LIQRKNSSISQRRLQMAAMTSAGSAGVVRQEDQRQVGRCIVLADTPQLFRIVPARLRGVELDDLIAAQ